MSEFLKDQVRKQTEIKDGAPTEVIDLHFQIQIHSHDTFEDLQKALHEQMDKRFNLMVAYEFGKMPARMEEGERWRQMGLFDDV